MQNKLKVQLFEKNDIRILKWAVHVSCTEDMRNSYKTLIRKPGRNRSLRGLFKDGH
jgi:hypothetical protein